MEGEVELHLASVDPALGAVIARVVEARGRVELKPSEEGTHFASLVRAILFQQLSGKAAATIHGRFEALLGGAVEPAGVLALSDEALRGVGVSGQKASYVKALAQAVQGGSLELGEVASLSDDELIAQLTRVKGVGVWSAQMFLMFRLGRPDVLPGLDGGVQRAIARMYALDAPPSPKEVARLGQAWAPYRTYASRYLWLSLEVP
jgi:DNA-3-methyladenine glycosylase II